MTILAKFACSFCILVCFLYPQVASQYQFPFIDLSSCAANEFFNSANQRCESCSAHLNGTSPTTNSLECACTRPSYRQVITASGNSDSPFTCELCASGTVASSDGTECISCPTTSGILTVNSNQCACSSATSALVERFDNGTILSTPRCDVCTATSTGPGLSTAGCVSCPTCGTCDCCTADDVCLNIITDAQITAISPPSDSAFINRKAPAAYAGCLYTSSPNITACQALSNMCVMELYGTSMQACALYSSLFNQRINLLDSNNPAWLINLPWIYYDRPQISPTPISDSVLTFTGITTSFSFKGANSVFDFVVMKYDVTGTYLGWESANTGILQMCPDRPGVKSAAFVFGTTYLSSCTLTFGELSDRSTYPAQFYELYLRYTDTFGVAQLFPVPVVISNLPQNTGSNTASWVLVKRFFLVSEESQTQTTTVIRYASAMAMWVTLQPTTGTGQIYPPFLRITYTDMATTAETATTTFSILYTMGMVQVDEAFKIALSVLGCLGVVIAFFETSGWRRRQGLQFIDGSSILMFVYFAMSMLANVFFIVMFGYAFVTLLIYKGQATVTVLLPTEDQQTTFVIFIALAFAFKAIEVLGMIFMQSLTDIFLIDWERPRVKDTDGKVSIWRTYFIANEWNEIQTFRKISFTFQLLAVLLFLEVIGFKSLALENPSSVLAQTTTTSSDQYIPVYNGVLRFAVAASVFIVVAVVQVIYTVAIHERFVQDKIREFIDLCSVSNMSVFILANNHYGYYIHGRSVHGKADTDMMDMNEMLKREEENLTSARGLEAGTDQQTFQILIPTRFRLQFDKIYQPLELVRNQPAARGGTTQGDSHMTESVKAYSTMRNFLTSFLDHSLRDLDYYVKEKMLLENLLDMEFQEPIDGAFFYNDTRNSFTNILFYGREFALLTFDILLFNIIDYSIQNYLLAAIITYIVGKFLVIIRQAMSRQNLAKKTLVDKRFLI